MVPDAIKMTGMCRALSLLLERWSILTSPWWKSLTKSTVLMWKNALLPLVVSSDVDKWLEQRQHICFLVKVVTEPKEKCCLIVHYC